MGPALYCCTDEAGWARFGSARKQAGWERGSMIDHHVGVVRGCTCTACALLPAVGHISVQGLQGHKRKQASVKTFDC
eukprot:1145636-Pelagomonas_calceolata.AAC.4